MPPIEPRFLHLAERFTRLIEEETGFNTIVCDETGHIVRATLRERIGNPHAGAQRIMRNEVDEAGVTAAEEAANPLTKEGMNCPIVVDGCRIGTFGISGPLAITRPLARVGAVVLGSWTERLQAAAAAGALSSGTPKRSRVLVVDDSPSTCQQVRELLEGAYDVITASNGADGFRAAKSAPPDVIVCDYEMPGLNGLQLLAAIRADPVLKTIPVIITTACSDGPASTKMLDAGAHDHLLKSAAPDELRARVDAALRSRATQHSLEAERQALARMAARLWRSEARTRAIIESALDAIILIGPGGEIESVNHAAEEIFGWRQGEAVGRPFIDSLVAPGSRERVRGALLRRGARAGDEGSPARSDAHGLHRDGHEFPIECRFRQLGTGTHSGSCAFVRNLTESRRLELELHQAQKLEAVGRLAAGIAHEINTPIQFIGDNTHFLEEAFASLAEILRCYAAAARPEEREALQNASDEMDLSYLLEQAPKAIARTIDGVGRVARIVRAMKEFAHPDQKQMVAADLNRAIEATLEVARNEYKYVADVETRFGELPPVICYASDLNQVVLNLVVNAAHAIEDVVRGTPHRGRIVVTTRHEGAEAVVTIADTGGGIPEAIRDKIFEPFFTTKEVGRGTGQGLAIARTIVARHRGSLHFESDMGRGTTFFIRIPINPPAEAGGR